MFNWLSNIIGLKQSTNQQQDSNSQQRQRLKFDELPKLIYAIGDVHGCLNLLQELEDKIANDCTKQKQEALIIMLGDYVDRGPDSAAVLDHLLSSPPAGTTRLCLAGNHEEAMLTFLQNPKSHADWLNFGGVQTLTSYGFNPNELNLSDIKHRNFIHKINSFIPNEHIDFLAKLPSIAIFPKYVFVHAGIRSEISLDAQSDTDLLQIRGGFLNHAGIPNLTVVHAHTPIEKPYISATRINIDTGAYISSHLSAIKIVNAKVAGILTS